MRSPWLIEMAQLFNTKYSDSSKGENKNNALKAAQKLSISIFVISLPLLYVSLLHVPPSKLFHDTTFWFLLSNSIIIIIAADGFLFSPSTESPNLVYDEYVKHSKARSTGLPASSIVTEPQILAVDSSNSLEGEANEEKVTEESTADKPPLAVANVVEERISRKEEDEEEEVFHEVDCPRSDENYVPEPLALVIENNERSISHRPAPERSQSEMGKRGRTVPETERVLRRSATEMKDRGGGEETSEYSNMSDEELNRRVEEFIRRFKEINLKELRNV